MGGNQMNNMQRFNDLTKPLLDLGNVLQIEPDTWIKKENLESISYSEDLNHESIKRIKLEHITSLKDTYGDAISFSFRLEDLVIFNLSQEISEASLKELHDSSEENYLLNFNLKLNKRKLIENLIGIQPECNFYLYFCPTVLEHLLESGLSRLENLFWGSEEDYFKRSIVIVQDRDIYLKGPYFSIIGGNRIEQLDQLMSNPLENPDNLKSMYDICRNNLNWETPWFKCLTPLHLEITECDHPTDLIAQRLFFHQINSILLYTAGKTTGNNEEPLTSTYAGTNHNIEIKLATDTSLIRGDVFPNVTNLMKILRWAYNDESNCSADRLTFTQIVIAQALNSASPFDRYKLLLHSSEGTYQSLMWQWRAFIEKKVDSYVIQVQVLEKDVSDTVQAYSNQIASIVKNLTETMLAAVAVLIGSAVATLVSKDFDLNILAIGLTSYAVYVFLFPLTYNMLYQHGQYKSLSDNFNHRKERFGKQLYPETVNNIIGDQMDKCQNRFKKWYWATLVIYIGVFFLSLAAALEVAGYINLF